MVTQSPRRSALMIAVAFTLSCVGLMIFVWTQFSGTVPFAPQGYQVKARFPETGLLVSGADVRISGIDVGRVTGVNREGRRSLVTMSIQQRYAPVPVSTRAILRQKTLLGEAYVELSAGSRAGPKLRDGGLLPESHVAKTQQLDQVLGAFGQPTQQDLERFLTGGAASLAGRAADLNSTLGNLDPAVSELSQVVTELDQERGPLSGLLRNGATVLTTLGQRAADIQTLIRAGDQVFSATAQRNSALAATIDRLPPFLSRLRITLNAVGHTLSLAGPSVTTLQRTAPLVRPALADVISLSGPALALLHAAPRLIHDSLKALPAIARFNKAFRPAVDELFPAVRQIIPVISFVSGYRRELTSAMALLAAALEGRAPANTNGYPDHPGSAGYLRSLAILDNESLFGQSIRAPTNRSNANFSSGELNNLAHGLLSASCANTGNVAQAPFGFQNVPCRVQPGFEWNHLVRYFPRVTAGSKP